MKITLRVEFHTGVSHWYRTGIELVTNWYHTGHLPAAKLRGKPASQAARQPARQPAKQPAQDPARRRASQPAGKTGSAVLLGRCPLSTALHNTLPAIARQSRTVLGTASRHLFAQAIAFAIVQVTQTLWTLVAWSAKKTQLKKVC